MPYFRYSSAEAGYLAARDPLLGAAINRIGHIDRAVFPDLFESVINAIAGQQISSKALYTVWKRLCDTVGAITPANLRAAGEERLRACGLSGRKAGYILSAAQAAADGTIDFAHLADMDDEAVIDALTVLPGVGRWTAEMMLIFSLERPDVLPYDDLGIRKGLCRLYGLDSLTKEQFAVYRARYAPHATIAALYLWEIAAGK
nr:DNA-3-methyladenine glycosylase [uncultured Agathobaculum sp.]